LNQIPILAHRLTNLYRAWQLQWKELLFRFEMNDIRQLRGRMDLLRYEGTLGRMLP
jgi:glutamate synthase domain-containing protein 2